MLPSPKQVTRNLAFQLFLLAPPRAKHRKGPAGVCTMENPEWKCACI